MTFYELEELEAELIEEFNNAETDEDHNSAYERLAVCQSMMLRWAMVNDIPPPK